MKKIDELGNKYGHWTVISALPLVRKANNRYRTVWLCRCICGREHTIEATALRNLKETASCGCQPKKYSIFVTDSVSTKRQPKEYNSWEQMKQRCHNPKNPGYKWYGALGVIVCDAWRNSFEQFYKDLGPKPGPDYSVDRYPNNRGNYEPGNCRWANRTEQARNTRRTRWLEFNGKRQSILDWARDLGWSSDTLYARLYRGWPTELILTRKPGIKNPHVIGRKAQGA